MGKWYGKNKERVGDAILIAGAFIMYIMWAAHLPVDFAPDEYMRYDIPKWIYEHNSLPYGNETELLNPVWGISYGFTPYLPSLIAVVFMKVFSVISTADIVLVFASRVPSVVAGVGTVVIALWIGREVFQRKESKYVFAVFVGFLPEFVFLCSYLNNDSFAVFCCMLIIYGWILGFKSDWTYKSCVIMAVGIGMCLLTYYNAYAYILCSVLIFCILVCNPKLEKQKRKSLIKKAIFISIIVFLIAGWYFIRNYFLYNGDFLGLNTSKLCSELNAITEYKPSNRMTYRNMGRSFFELVFDKQWLISTIKSFIACFGYMSVWTNSWIYIFYCLIIIIGVIFYLKYIKDQGLKRNELILFVMMICCIMIPVFLSLYNSYASDYQAQGRYVISSLPSIMLISTTGYDYMATRVRYKKKWLTCGLIAVWLALYIYIFNTIILPVCWGGII